MIKFNISIIPIKNIKYNKGQKTYAYTEIIKLYASMHTKI